MNRLLTSLLHRPDVVADAVRRPDTVSFAWLVDVLGPAFMDEREHAVLNKALDQDLLFEAGYLPVITVAEWEEALRSAPAWESSRPPEWWTVMIPSESAELGLTVPQDSSEKAVVTLFAGDPDAAELVTYDPARGEVRLLQETEEHCLPPSRGRCAAGSCGDCQGRQVYDKDSKLISLSCECPH